MSKLQYTEDRELLSKKIYGYCLKVEWEPNKLEEFAKELNITSKTVKRLARQYAREHLTEEDFKQLSQEISGTSKKKTINSVPKLYIINPILLELREKETYYLWENTEEKELVLEYIFNYCGGLNWQHDAYKELVERIGFDKAHIKLLIKKYAESYLSTEEYNLLMENMDEKSFLKKQKESLQLPIINPILLKLIRKETFYLWENDKEKELVLKYIYEYCDKNILERDVLPNFACFIGINLSTLQKLRRQYAIEYLKLTEEEYKEYLAKQAVNNSRLKIQASRTKYKDIFEELLNASDLTEIITILNGKNIPNLRKSVNCITDLDMKKRLLEKINMYTNYISTQRKELKKQEQISIAQKIVREFIDDDTSKSTASFCKKKGISIAAFRKYVDLVAENDFELFSLYNVKTTDTQKVAFHGYVDKIKTMVFYLENGIEEFGVVRQFDLIDYFLLTKMEPKDILCTAKKIISKNEFNLLSIFFCKNASGFNIEANIIKQIMDERVIVRYEKDKKGNPIPGTEEFLADEEKSKIINFLNENKIPLNLKTYNLAYRRYINETLDLNFRKQGLRKKLEKKEGEKN